MGLAAAAPLFVLGLLEAGSHLFVGAVDYPLPGVESAAQHIFFLTPERISPMFRPDGDHIVAGFENKTHFLVRRQRFPALRSPEAVRVAFLGGSSVQGWPYRQPGASFPDVVGELLQARFPDRRVDIINAGVGGYSSFQIADAAHQLGPLNPDIVVLYAGHNDQGYYGFQQGFLDAVELPGLRSAVVGPLERQANRLNFFRAARRSRDRAAAGPAKKLGEDVFRGTADQRQSLGEQRFATFAKAHSTLVPRMFEQNLAELIEALEDEDTDVVLVPPVSNLRDHAPTEMLHLPPLRPAEATAFAERLETLRDRMAEQGLGPRTMPPVWETWIRFDDPVEPQEPGLEVGSVEAARGCVAILEELDALEAISSSWAETSFLRGTCLLHSDPAAALAAFERARDQTYALPPHQRAWGTMQEAVRSAAQARDVEIVELPARMREAAEFGVPGGEMFVDNLHLSGLGARVVGEAVAAALAELPVFREGEARHRRPEPELAVLRRNLATAASERHFAHGLDIRGSDPHPVTPEQRPDPPPCQSPTVTGDLPAGTAERFRLESKAGALLRMRLDGAAGIRIWIADLEGRLTAGPFPRPLAAWSAPGDGDVVLLVGVHEGEGGPWQLCLEGLALTEELGRVRAPAAAGAQHPG